MKVSDHRRLFDYGYWANARLYPVLEKLTDEEFTRQVAGSYGSIRNTLVHVLSAEWGWMERCGGPARGPRLDPNDFPTLRSVRVTWEKVERDMRAFLATLRDEDLDRPITWTLGEGESHTDRLGHLLHHSTNHAVHHRGQVAMLLRMLGHAPGNFDLLFFDP